MRQQLYVAVEAFYERYIVMSSSLHHQLALLQHSVARELHFELVLFPLFNMSVMVKLLNDTEWITANLPYRRLRLPV